MDDAAKAFLFDLLNTPSPSGFEAAGQRRWAEHVRTFADGVESDHYGNTWATLHGTPDAPRLMLEAHADEIGFMINHIGDDGFLYVIRVGGSDRAIARGKRIRILGSKEPVIGLIGNTAIHLRDSKDDKVPEWHDLFVDIGASSKKEVEERGLRVGHPAVYAESAEELTPGRLVGRALDNRIGGFIIAQALARLAADTPRPTATVQAVNSVQEELGGHGAKMITYRLNPSVAVVIDVTHATDSPGISKAKHGAVSLGKGPTLSHGSANHPKVVERLLEVAEKAEIPIQHEATSRFTGTDTDDVFVSRAGVPSALISLPMRYMHSPIEMVDLTDVEHCIALLTTFARSLQNDDDFRAEI